MVKSMKKLAKGLLSVLVIIAFIIAFIKLQLFLSRISGSPLAVIIIFIIFIDGVKLCLESFASYKKRETFSEPKLTTAIIACRNEEDSIVKTIEAAAKILPAEQIIIIDDESTDKTAEKVEQSGYKVKLLKVKHRGKANAIKAALAEVKTPFTLLLDADVMPENNFQIPTSLIQKTGEFGGATAAAFNVMPSKPAKNESGWKKLIVSLQSHEYAKSMQIGKKSHDRTKSVHCISGAAGLFRTERLKALSEYHTGIFPGEDLERTLIELTAGGSVVFADNLIVTETPKTLRGLIKQRVIGWWPGLVRNLPLFFSLIFKKGASARLRLEMVYEIFSLATDPLKVLALAYIIITAGWQALVTTYTAYLALEIACYLRMKNGYADHPWLTISIFPFYAMLQMLLRVLAYGVFFWRRFVKKDWKALADAGKIVIGLAIIFFSFTADADLQIMTVNKAQYVSDSTGRQNKQIESFWAFKNQAYLGISYGAINQGNVGGYIQIKGIVLNPDLRLRENDTMPKLTLEKTLAGPIVGRLSSSYVIAFEQGENFPVIGGGADMYYGDYNLVSLDIIKEFGRKHGMTYVAKNHLKMGKWWWNAGIAMTNFYDFGAFTEAGYWFFLISAEHYKNFDFNNFDRTAIGGGIKLLF